MSSPIPSGLYLYRKGESFQFRRYYADGEVYSVAVGSRSSRQKVLSDVKQWFDRDRRIPNHCGPHQLQVQDNRIWWGYRSSWTKDDFEVDVQPQGDGSLLEILHNLTKGARFEYLFEFIGDDAAAAPTTVNANTASAKELRSLIGVGPKRAERIIMGRPYTDNKDLKRVLSESLLKELGDLIDT